MKIQTNNLLNTFNEDLRSFNQRTIYISFFDLAECDLYHIESEPDKSYIRLLNTRQTIDVLNHINGNAEIKATDAIYKDRISNSVLSKIESKNITSLLIYDSKVLFLDESARSMISQKCKATGPSLYSKDYVADIILQANMKAYKPTTAAKHYPIAVVRKDEKSLVLKALLSKPANEFDLSYEVKNKLTLTDYEITENGIFTRFDTEEYEGYIISVLVNWSDIGRGNGKRLAIRPTGTETSVPLFDINDDYDLDECIANAKHYINAKSEELVNEPGKLFRTVKGLDAIGVKRVKGIIMPELKNLSEREFYLKLLGFPDVIGKINRSTDETFLNALGESFKAGAF